MAVDATWKMSIATYPNELGWDGFLQNSGGQCVRHRFDAWRSIVIADLMLDAVARGAEVIEFADADLRRRRG